MEGMDSIKVSRAIMVASSILLVLGVACFSASMTVVSASSGMLGGIWYVGIAAIFAGINGFLKYTSQPYRNITVTSTIVLVLAVVGSVISASQYNFFEKLEACASFVSDGDGNCAAPQYNVTAPFFDCYGDSTYYAGAVYCEALSTSTDCSCVTTSAINSYGDGYTCYEFDGPPCDNILTSIPSSLHATYALSMIVLFASLVMTSLSCTAAYRPQYIDPSITVTTATIVQHPQGTVVLTPGQDVYVLDQSSAKPTIVTTTANPMGAPVVHGSVQA